MVRAERHPRGYLRAFVRSRRPERRANLGRLDASYVGHSVPTAPALPARPLGRVRQPLWLTSTSRPIQVTFDPTSRPADRLNLVLVLGHFFRTTRRRA